MSFSTSHFLLAWKYKEVARDIPKVLKKEELKDDSKSQRTIFVVLLTLNIVVPLVNIVAAAVFGLELLGEKTSAFPLIFANVVSLSIGVLQIISGIYLVKSVSAIRKAYKDISEQSLDTCSIAVHAAAFGLYLLAFVVLVMAGVFRTLYYENTAAIKTYLLSYDFYMVANYISQACLCVIFKDLGKAEIV